MQHTPQRLLVVIGLLAASVLCTLSIATVRADENQHVTSYQAMGRKVTDWNSPNANTQLEFKTNDLKAALKQNGQVFIEGGVQHAGLLCGTYQIGIKFGTGTQACTDIQWLSEIQYLTERKQCNNAFLFHNGGGDFPEIVDNYDAINCAEFLVRCTGTCK